MISRGLNDSKCEDTPVIKGRKKLPKMVPGSYDRLVYSRVHAARCEPGDRNATTVTVMTPLATSN